MIEQRQGRAVVPEFLGAQIVPIVDVNAVLATNRQIDRPAVLDFRSVIQDRVESLFDVHSEGRRFHDLRAGAQHGHWIGRCLAR